MEESRHTLCMAKVHLSDILAGTRPGLHDECGYWRLSVTNYRYEKKEEMLDTKGWVLMTGVLGNKRSAASR
jgi:hypothetical protein